MTTLNKYKEAKKKIADAIEEGRALAKDYFKECAASLFEKHPALESFSWRQYTPYFNDGDECTFGAHTDYIKVNDEDDEGDGIGWDSVKKQSYEEPGEVEDARRAAIKFLSNFDDDDMKSMFGDHCEVTVTKDSVDVEEYEHE